MSTAIPYEPSTPILSRTEVQRWMESRGYKPWKVRTMIDQGLIKGDTLPGHTYKIYYRDQIARDVLGRGDKPPQSEEGPASNGATQKEH